MNTKTLFEHMENYITNEDIFSLSVETLQERSKGIPKEKEKYRKKLSEVDKKIANIKHVVEFEPLSGDKMLKSIVNLKKLLKKRREYKTLYENVTKLEPIYNILVNLKRERACSSYEKQVFDDNYTTNV